ncbi:hypothetical protein J1N10_19710 [Carboxylicivirga sp. A043]|uniref:hypothetical protein n=1 Tax=Carboxylicivirga litoralis TaxID=2816963 RepID=UPI0021CB6E39|nr:hypothetical protein [Carboxylicivirga sp. A043]MCU4158211.1 hypothetical protein [Carboxylicivirga sp. A043]
MHTIKSLAAKAITFGKLYFVESILLTLFIVDAYSFYIDSSIGLHEDKRFSFVFRAVIEITLLLVVYKKKEYNKKYVFYALILLVLPLIWLLLGYIYNENLTITFNQIFQIVKESNKYIFPVIVFWAFSLSRSKHVLKVFELIYLVSAVVVINAFLTDNGLFYTYGQIRFGFKPMIAAHNEATLFWIIGIVYQVDKLKKEKKFQNFIPFITIVIASVLLGTKAIVLFYLMISAWGLIKVSSISNLYKWIGVAFIFTSLSFFVYYSGIYHFFEERFHTQGILYSLTSMRNEIIVSRVIPTLNNWNWYNYFIGGYFQKLPIAEMDLVDLFVFYGGLGALIYFTLIFKTLFAFSRDNLLGLFFVSQYILIGALAGHFFTSGTNAVYIVILCIYLQGKFDSSQKKNNITS